MSNRRIGDLVVKSSVPVAVLAVWYVIGSDESRMDFPTPTRTVQALWSMISDGTLIEALLATNQALVIGFLASCLVGIPLGIGVGLIPRLGRVAVPILTIFMSLPLIALVPVIQVIFGLTLAARAAVVMLFAWPFVVFNVVSGVRSIDRHLEEMAHSFGARRWQRLRRVILPGSLAHVMAGIRVGLGRAVSGMVVGELVLVGAGLGSLLSHFQGRFETAHVMGIVVVIVVEGVVLTWLAAKWEGRLLRWRDL